MKSQRNPPKDKLFLEALSGRGSVYSLLGEAGKAEQDIRTAIGMKTPVKSRKIKANLYISLAHISESISDYDAMKKNAETALKHSASVKDRIVEAKAINLIGQYYGAQGNYDLELKYLLKVEKSLRKLLKSEKNPRIREEALLMLGTTANNIGFVLRMMNKQDKALSMYEESLSIRRKIGDRTGEAQSLNNIGMFYGRGGDYEKCLHYFNQSLAIYHSIGEKKGLAGSYMNIGYVYNILKEEDRMMEYFNNALGIQRQINDKYGEGLTLLNLGYISLGKEQLDKAMMCFNESLKIMNEIKHYLTIAKLYFGIGEVYGKLGNHEFEYVYFSKAKELFDKINDPREKYIILESLVKLCTENPDICSPENYKSEMEKLAEQMQLRKK